jgi:hypothetical protein
MSREEHKDAIEVSIIFHEGQRMFAVPKQPAPVQEPVGKVNELFDDAVIENCGFDRELLVYTTPPAQEFVCSTGLCHYKAVPDAITDRSESPEYIQGWNDCRAEMLKGMKP